MANSRFPVWDDPPVEATVLRMMLGGQLRRRREAARITPERAGLEIRASRSKISRLETGRVGLKGRDVKDLLTLYGVTDEGVLEKVLALVRQSNTPDWWAKYSDILPEWFEAYLGLESAASTIRSFEIQFVHGLFQTEDYARAYRPGPAARGRPPMRSRAGSGCASTARPCTPGRSRQGSGRSWTRRCCGGPWAGPR